jgi:hypothetical protein
MESELSLKEWFFKRDGKECGPVSALQLKQLLATGQLQPRQAIWKQANRFLLYYVRAATIARGGDAEAAR